MNGQQTHQIEEEFASQEIGAAKSVKHEKKDADGNVINKPREDRMLFAPQDHVFAVFDGLGAHGNGDRAAQTARDFFADAVKRIPNDLTAEETAEYLHDLTLEIHNQLPTQASGRTTMILAYIYEAVGGKKKLITVTIGDSRLYRLRNNQLICLTIDNEDPSRSRDEQLAIQNKLSTVRTRPEYDSLSEAEQEAFGARNIVQALGGEETLPIIDIHDLQMHDILLLTSDGITNNLADQQMESIILHHSDPTEAVNELVNAAKSVANDGTNLRAVPDDMTAQLIKIEATFPERTPVASPDDDSESWITVASEMITAYPQHIQDVRTKLGRELSPSELFYVISNGNVDLIQQVEPLYHKLKRARAHLIGTEDYNDFKQLERSQRTNTYDYVRLKRLVTLASIQVASREEIEVYATLQQLTPDEKENVRNYFATQEARKPEEANYVMQIIFRSAFGQMVPTFETF